MASLGTIVLSLWILFWIIWAVFAILTTRQQKERLKHIITYPLVILFIILIALFFSNLPPELACLEYRLLPSGFIIILIGFVVMIFGQSIAVWARVDLGRSWRGDINLTPSHQLIQTGPYKYVRHPIYSGLIFGMIGTFIIIGEIWMLIMLFVTLFALIPKSYSEEKLLLQMFPAAYQQYKKKVKAFVPFLL